MLFRSMIESKRELADAVLAAGGVEGAVSELSTAELAELVSLRGAGEDGRGPDDGRGAGDAGRGLA